MRISFFRTRGLLFKLIVFFIFLTIVILINLYPYCYFCLPYPVTVDYKYVETEADLLSDIEYARALFVPTKSPLELNENYMNQKRQYQKQMENIGKFIWEQVSLGGVLDTYIPQVLCPTIARIGKRTHGSYFLCNPWLLGKSQEKCIIYSLGIYEEVGFEMVMDNVTNHKCDIFSFDEHEESQDLFKPFRGTYMRAFITDKTDESKGRYSLLDIMKKFGHTKIDILKMDIEGAEFGVLPAFLRKYNGTVCQIVMEMHGNGYGVDVKLWLRMFQMLERRGYRMFYREPNAYHPHCYLYSYIHLSCFQRFDLHPQSVLFTYFV